MSDDLLETLQDLHDRASAAPWHVLFANDDLCMNATLVTRNPDGGRIVDYLDGSWQPDDVVAACLLQSPEVAVSVDGRYDANATLIAAMRNAMPELLRLATLGLDAKRKGSE